MFRKCTLFVFPILYSLLLVLSTNAHGSEIDHSHAQFAEILEVYTMDGLVDYKRLKEEPSRLDTYLNTLAKVKEAQFYSWKENEKLAYLINLYNAATLKLIIKHYPVESIRKIGWFWFYKGPWDQKFISLFGKNTDLNFIEHDLLRTKYSEPRIHFALVCAALSCPQLRHEPYTADKLDWQLDEQAKRFLSSSGKNFVDHPEKKIFLSSIFTWFKDDFTKEGNTLQNYVYPYLENGSSESNAQDYDVEFLDYNWQLNEWVRQ